MSFVSRALMSWTFGAAMVCFTLTACKNEPEQTPRASAPPISTASTPTLPPGSKLPTDAECASRVERNSWEPRPDNAIANHTMPDQPLRLPPWPDYFAADVNTSIVPRIDGAFTGTTDEIIRWGACKWGFDAQLVRAIAVAESDWNQSQLGDYENDPSLCVGDYASPCPTSFGLLQIKHIYRPGSYPDSQLSTSFNIDYGLAVIRACFEGSVLYLDDTDYGPGDFWGCAGWHFSGYWKDQPAKEYIGRVETALSEQRWQHW